MMNKDDVEIVAGPIKIEGTLARWIKLSDGSGVVQIYDGTDWIKSDGTVTLKDFFPPNLD